ncbi:ATP-binding protein [Nonomuraea sp. NPDC050786]|uniref:ATP-binding protein n=1 Tax=Nonomuraea sp. NPDC050786 TaxID=3154840 RepID=UPI0033ED6986
MKLWLADIPSLVCPDAPLQIVSELVSNVIQHVPAGPRRDWIKVRLGLGEGFDFVRLEVIDPGIAEPEPRFVPLELGSMSESGRGLGIVASLSKRCGTYVLERGHRAVWADLGIGSSTASCE